MALIKTVFQFRRATTEEWLANSGVIPAPGEPCFDLTAHTLKIGDGNLTYAELPTIGGVELKVEGDGKSIVLKDNVFQLMGFEGAEVGAQPRKNADGELEWVVPSTETVEGLKSTVAGLQSDVESLQTNVTNITKIVMPAEGETGTILDRVESLETKMDGTGEGTVDAKIDAKIEAFASALTPEDDKVNTLMELINYIESHGKEALDMAAEIDALQELVGSTSVADQIAAAGHITKAEAEETLLSKVEAAAVLKHVKYEISHKPVGTLVNYGDKEIRIMVPADTKFEHQNSGENADKNQYYIGFKAYAPEGAVSFKEDLAEIISDNTMYYFEGNDFAGIDAYGRKYSICWLAVAYYDEATQTWIRYADKSSKEKYLGYYYSVEWYDANGVKIDSDCIRINLSNEDCHNTAEPYYMGKVVKGVKLGGTLMDTVDHLVDIPVGAGLKASKEIEIAEDGTMSVGVISWDKITEGDGELVLDGGGAAAN